MFAPKAARAQTKAAESPTRKLALQLSTLVARPFGGGAVDGLRGSVQQFDDTVAVDGVVGKGTIVCGGFCRNEP
jgi:hypothetical protein